MGTMARESLLLPEHDTPGQMCEEVLVTRHTAQGDKKQTKRGNVALSFEIVADTQQSASTPMRTKNAQHDAPTRGGAQPQPLHRRRRRHAQHPQHHAHHLREDEGRRGPAEGHRRALQVARRRAGWGAVLLVWGAACEMGAVRSQPRCFRVMLYAEAASVRRGDLCVHSQANSYFICVHPGAERTGPAPRTGTARSGRLIGTALGLREPWKNSKNPPVRQK